MPSETHEVVEIHGQMIVWGTDYANSKELPQKALSFEAAEKLRQKLFEVECMRDRAIKAAYEAA
jgi:hypothetical protein